MKSIGRNEELFLAKDFETLYRENESLMSFVAKKYLYTGVEYDDLIGLGNIAFMKATEKFDPSTAKWSTYFPLVMRGLITNYIRDLKQDMPAISFEDIQVYHKDDSKAISFIDTVADDYSVEDLIIQKQLRVESLAYIDKLSGNQAKCMYMRLLGLTQSEIAEHMNMRQTQVSRILIRGCEILQNCRDNVKQRDMQDKDEYATARLKSKLIEIINAQNETGTLV